MSRPNILLIMSDEHDSAVSSPYGHPFVNTPAMQGLADAGAVFEQAYCNSPLCTPSRASFMTGRHVHHSGVWDNSGFLKSDELTWAHRLEVAGYDTCLAGKMHFVGPDQMHGFGRRIVPDIHGMVAIGGNVPNWETLIPIAGQTPRKRLTEQPGPGNYVHLDYDDLVTAKTVTYLSEPDRHEKPWALVASIFTPHIPFICRPEFYDRYYPEHADLPEIPEGHLEAQHAEHKAHREYFDCNDIPEEQIRKARAAYYGLVEFADDRLGAMLDALERNGLAEDTLVIYTSDHGEMLGEHGMWNKNCSYEQAMRVPLLMRWPGVIEPGMRYSRIASLLDVTATMIDIAGAADHALDGDSLLPLLRGDAQDGGGTLLAEYEGHAITTPWRLVRRGRHKLTVYADGPPELYDLAADPGEFNDLATDPAHAPVVEELRAVATADWDPPEIKARVERSQRDRRLIGQGHSPWGGSWRNGKFG
jgi:choline-sulfatase